LTQSLGNPIGGILELFGQVVQKPFCFEVIFERWKERVPKGLVYILFLARTLIVAYYSFDSALGALVTLGGLSFFFRDAAI
jgi:hypothetical protein